MCRQISLIVAATFSLLILPGPSLAARAKIPARIRETGKIVVEKKERGEVLIPGETFKFDDQFGPFQSAIAVGTLDCLPYNDLPLDGHPALAWRLLGGAEHYPSGWNYHVIAVAGVVAKGSRFLKLLSLGCPSRVAGGRIQTFVNNWRVEVPKRDLFSFEFFEMVEHAHALGVRDLNMSDIKFAPASCNAKRFNQLSRAADDVLAGRAAPDFRDRLAAFNRQVRRHGCLLFWLGKALERHPETLLFVAAGNSGFDNDAQRTIYPTHFPLPNVVAVAAAEDPVGHGRPRGDSRDARHRRPNPRFSDRSPHDPLLGGGTVARCSTERGAVRWRIGIWPTKRRSAWGRRTVTLATNATDVMTTIERYAYWSAEGVREASRGARPADDHPPTWLPKNWKRMLRPSPWFKVGNGTSLAAPEAANVSAKLRLIAPRLTAAERKTILARTSDICPRTPLAIRSGGVVNADRAFSVAKRLRDDPALNVDDAIAAEVGATRFAELKSFWARWP